MTAPDNTAADEGRVARLLLAALDDDRAACDKVKAEIEHSQGGWKAVFGALAETHMTLLCANYGESLTRSSLQAAALDTSLHE